MEVVLFFAECENGNIVLTLKAFNAFLGPVEICLHNKWHRVCDSHWSQEDATVACRQLQLPHSGV